MQETRAQDQRMCPGRGESFKEQKSGGKKGTAQAVLESKYRACAPHSSSPKVTRKSDAYRSAGSACPGMRLPWDAPWDQNLFTAQSLSTLHPSFRREEGGTEAVCVFSEHLLVKERLGYK